MEDWAKENEKLGTGNAEGMFIFFVSGRNIS